MDSKHSLAGTKSFHAAAGRTANTPGAVALSPSRPLHFASSSFSFLPFRCYKTVDESYVFFPSSFHRTCVLSLPHPCHDQMLVSLLPHNLDFNNPHAGLTHHRAAAEFAAMGMKLLTWTSVVLMSADKRCNAHMRLSLHLTATSKNFAMNAPKHRLIHHPNRAWMWCETPLAHGAFLKKRVSFRSIICIMH